MTRSFEDKPAVPEATPCLVGIIGPSRTGKTFSALRLATGMQRVVGGDIGVIDTEAKRAIHYAKHFKFRHLPFTPPFRSVDYLDAIKHFVNKGVKTIIVDSTSHEHDGPGGMLERHIEETKRLAAAWKTKESAAQITAWVQLKAERRKMVNEILQLNANIIFCFRAKEKLKVVKGSEPIPRGYQPIASEEFLYEFVVNFLLLPGSKGVPSWDKENDCAGVEVPEQFKELLAPKVALSEDIGEAIARWSAAAPAKGSTKSPTVALMEQFATIGVTEEQVMAYIGHPVESMTEDERKDLRSIGAKIKGQETTWAAATAPSADKTAEPL